jgi:uncharacterized protein (DUF1330 family)
MQRAAISILATALVFAPVGKPAKSAEQKGYVVGTVTFENKDWVGEYRPKTAKLVEKYGGRILVRGKPVDVLEGSAPDADAILVVEFPSVQKARAWYNDADYAPLKVLRQGGSKSNLVLINALPQ